MEHRDADFSRRAFLRKAGLSPLALGLAAAVPWSEGGLDGPSIPHGQGASSIAAPSMAAPNMLGAYGPWASDLVEGPLAFSFRHQQWTDVDTWRTAARERLMNRLAQPDSGGIPEVTLQREYTYDGLHVEELTWQLPYGPPTKALLLKPEEATEALPGILALHDHGGNKYFGRRKVTRTADEQHPVMAEHQEDYYGGAAWANEVARRGYVVLVPDTFTFASRRVRLKDVPEAIRREASAAVGLSEEGPEEAAAIAAYNRWAADHESIMAKSLFSAGTTWPGVFLGEDQRALDVLCARTDVDADRVGCCGLSGGGLRTVMLGGADPRIKGAVCVGMMTTWEDYLLNTSYTHTWMIYVPLLPRELDYSEILGLRVPKPTLVLNNREDPLFTMPEQERADAILQEVYEEAGAGERYQCSFYPGSHKFDRDMQAEAFEWFDRWL